MKNVEWFFDFVSPFSYLQFERIADVESRAHMTLTPVVLAGILNHWGQKGPAEIPAKRRFTYRFVQWQADRQGTALKFPPMHPFNPLRALRALHKTLPAVQPPHIEAEHAHGVFPSPETKE